MTKCKSTLDSGCSFVQNQISNLRSSGLTAPSILSAPRRLLIQLATFGAFWWDIAVVRKTSCPRRSLAVPTLGRCTGCRGKEKKGQTFSNVRYGSCWRTPWTVRVCQARRARKHVWNHTAMFLRWTSDSINFSLPWELAEKRLGAGYINFRIMNFHFILIISAEESTVHKAARKIASF